MLGNRLLAYRRREGMSQQQLADKLGVARSTVARWEKDNNAPSVPELKKISELLGLSEQELFSEEDDRLEDDKVSDLEETISDISYGVNEQRKVLEEISSKHATSSDIEKLRDTIDVSKEQLEIQREILHQKKVRNLILIILAIVIAMMVGLLLYGIAFYSDDTHGFYVDGPVIED
ncbi:MAG: helix-turn-helix domain-containing protein [Clostridiales bacterium]|nr:helix-turn-helix domain-containing protein [Clostridiales bacterium]